MEGLSTDKAPSLSVVLPHFVFAGIAFMVLSVMVVLSSGLFSNHFYQPKLLAITHVFVLGWASMIIIGSLYQLIPVVFETALFSERLAKFNFWFFAFGVIYFTYSFWMGNLVNGVPWASIFTFTSFILFGINVIMSTKKAEKKTFSSKFVIASIWWLMATAIQGIVLAFNYKYQYLNDSDFKFLRIHAHFGFVGWFLLLIMGVASVLVPMFLVSHQLDENKLKRAYYSVNMGLLLLSLNWYFFSNAFATLAAWVIIMLGIVFYLSFIYDSYKKKLRKLDVGMKHSLTAFAIIVLPVVLALLASLQHDFSIIIIKNVALLYGFSIFFGFMTTLILGQTYKTLPFIIWLDRYTQYIGKRKVPMPREIYNETIADTQLYVYLIFVILFFIGIILSNTLVLKVGSLFLLLTAILYNINVFKIVFHKVKPEKSE